MNKIKYPTKFGYMHDVNGDKSERILAAFVVVGFILIMSAIIIIYGLSHTIESSSLISTIILGLITLVGTLLAAGAFQKPRDPCEEDRGDNNHE
jgi:hypothetical protein